MNKILLAVIVLALSGLACAIPAQSVPSANTLKPAPLTAPKVPTLTPEPLPTPETAVVTASEALHVRQEPGETALVIGYLLGGETVTLTGRCSGEPSGWAEIDWKQSVAWVNSDYLSKNKCSEDE